MSIYANSITTNSPFLIISGQTPQKERVIPENIEGQLDIVIEKIQALLLENNASVAQIVKMNIYITERSFLPAVREKLASYLQQTKPAMTLVIVTGLVDPKFKVEIDALVSLGLTAV